MSRLPFWTVIEPRLVSVAGLRGAIETTALPAAAAEPTFIAPLLTNWSCISHWRVPGPETAMALAASSASLSVPSPAEAPGLVNWKVPVWKLATLPFRLPMVGLPLFTTSVSPGTKG